MTNHSPGRGMDLVEEFERCLVHLVQLESSFQKLIAQTAQTHPHMLIEKCLFKLPWLQLTQSINANSKPCTKIGGMFVSNCFVCCPSKIERTAKSNSLGDARPKELGPNRPPLECLASNQNKRWLNTLFQIVRGPKLSPGW